MTLRQTWIRGATALALALAVGGIGAGAQERGAPQQQRAQAPREQRAGTARTAEPRLDPQATAVVRRMGEYMRSLRSFRVTADTMTELVLRDGQKIHDLVRSEVTMQRPNKLRAERQGPLGHVTFVYDGDQILLAGHDQHQHATANAPNDLDGALDHARERLSVEAPGADLLYTDAYEGLMRDAESGMYLGQIEVDGVVCDHVAFHSDYADWQLWVERGERALPRRYVITTNDQEARPEFIVELREWNLSPTVSASTFAVTPPPNSRRVSMASLVGGAREQRAAREAKPPREEGPGKVIGRPLTPVSAAGVARRTARRRY